jgi:indolepyruvate ferredoxin oxidoreductase beta subunit
MVYDIYLVGVGGQGVLTISEIITEAAVKVNIPVNYYPTEGMAQRGGFVKAQVRLGRSTTGPNIPEKGADLVISMELSESLKAVRYIKPNGEFVIWGYVWAPTAVILGKANYPSPALVKEQVKAATKNIIYIPPETLPDYLGEQVPDNLFVLGTTVKHTLLRKLLSSDQFINIIQHKWPKAADRNSYAFTAGFERQIDTVKDAVA